MATKILDALSTAQVSSEFTLTEQKAVWISSPGALHPEACIIIEAKNADGSWSVVETLHYNRRSGVLAPGTYRATRVAGIAVAGLEHA